MSKKILTFGASNSDTSINKRLANYAAKLLSNCEVNLIDLNDYEMPLYSVDKEEDNGIPELALKFKQLIRDADGLVISLAEHNGAYTVAFKNILDWISRIEKNIWCNKPMLLMSTAPGPRGGKTVLNIAKDKFSRMTEGGVVTFSLPNFGENFSEAEGIKEATHKVEFESKLEAFSNLLN